MKAFLDAVGKGLKVVFFFDAKIKDGSDAKKKENGSNGVISSFFHGPLFVQPKAVELPYFSLQKTNGNRMAGSSLPMKPNAAGANLRVFHILKNILQNTALEVNAQQKFGRKYQLQKMGNRHVFQPSTKKPPRVPSVALFI